MGKNKILLLLLVLAFPLLISSRCGDTRIREGTARDTIFAVDQHYNGAYSVWMTHDDIVGYCTMSEELGQRALGLLEEHDGEVVIKYWDIHGLDEEADFWNVSECGNIGTSTEMVVLTDIWGVKAR